MFVSFCGKKVLPESQCKTAKNGKVCVGICVCDKVERTVLCFECGFKKLSGVVWETGAGERRWEWYK